jgi:hypothetical protein
MGGYAVSGVAWGSSRGRTKLPRNRRPLRSKQYRPVEVFTLSGGIGIRLEEGAVERPAEGIAHWLAAGLGIFAKQVERYSIEEFLERFFQFLKETRLQKILLIEIDYNAVYKDKRDTYNDDLEQAIISARQYLAKDDRVGNKVLISALGKTKIDPMKDLHLTVEGQYYQKHGFGKPAIQVRVTGIPSALLPRRKETKLQFTARQAILARRIHSPRKLASFRKGCEKTFGIVLTDYEGHLERVFDVDKTEKEVSSWGSIPQR